MLTKAFEFLQDLNAVFVKTPYQWRGKRQLFTYIPLLISTLCMIFLSSWKSCRSSGFSTQHCFITSLSCATPVMTSVTAGRNGGQLPDFTQLMISVDKTLLMPFRWFKCISESQVRGKRQGEGQEWDKGNKAMTRDRGDEIKEREENLH